LYSGCGTRYFFRASAGVLRPGCPVTLWTVPGRKVKRDCCTTVTGPAITRSLDNRRWVVGPRGDRSLSRPAAASLAAQNPPRGTEIFIHADVPQGHGGSLKAVV